MPFLSSILADSFMEIFDLEGELKTPSGCLRAAPISGVQLWAKPINTSSSAVLLKLVGPVEMVKPFRLAHNIETQGYCRRHRLPHIA